MRITMRLLLSILALLTSFSIQAGQLVPDGHDNPPRIQTLPEGYDLIYLAMSSNNFRLRRFDFDLFVSSEIAHEYPDHLPSDIALSPDTMRIALGSWSLTGNIPEVQIAVLDLSTGEETVVFQEQSESFVNLMDLAWVAEDMLGFIVDYSEIRLITVEIGGGYAERSLISIINPSADKRFVEFNGDYSTVALIERVGNMAAVRFVDLATMDEYETVFSTPATNVFTEHNFTWARDNQQFLIMDGVTRNWISVSPVGGDIENLTNVGGEFYLTYPAPSPDAHRIAFRAYRGTNWRPESVFYALWDGTSLTELPFVDSSLLVSNGWHPRSGFLALVNTTHDEEEVLYLLDTEDFSYYELDRLSAPYTGTRIVGWTRAQNTR